MYAYLAYFNYQSYNFPEDNILINRKIDHSYDAFFCMQECYLHFVTIKNDGYSITTHWDKPLKLFKQRAEECNLGHIHYYDKPILLSEDEIPSFYYEGKEMFDNWRARVESLVPRLRKLKERNKIKTE